MIIALHNKNLTSEFVREHYKNDGKFPPLATFGHHSWCTIEFVKSLGGDSLDIAHAYDYTVDMYKSDYYDGNEATFYYIPVEVVYNLYRYDSEFEPNILPIGFESHDAFDLSVINKQIAEDLDLLELCCHPDMTWKYVIDHPEYNWPDTSNMSVLIDDAIALFDEPIEDIFLGRNGISMSEWHLMTERTDWPTISCYVDIHIVLSEPHHPWSWDLLNTIEVYYKDIKDHLHLPWHWPSLSKNIIVTTNEYLNDKTLQSLMVMSKYAKNVRAKWLILKMALYV